MIVTRFAPSPTGYLHVGGARTALFCWLLARRHGGRMILRIEDTDRKRNTPTATQQVIDDLRWLGIDWDEGPDVGGPNGPYLQSERREIYDKYVKQLLDEGKAYCCFETAQELQAMREEAAARKQNFIYRRGEIVPDAAEVEKARAQGRDVVVRFAVPEGQIVVNDIVRGEVVFQSEQIGDFVICKSDGFPTYHFACVVDDELMGVTHVIRGQEHLMNTPGHIALQQALGFGTPAYAHMSVTVSEGGGKLSKRERAKTLLKAMKDHPEVDPDSLAAAGQISRAELDDFIAGNSAPDQPSITAMAQQLDVQLPEINVVDFARSGYLPEALMNFLALLGWNPGDDREVMQVDELIAAFDINRLTKTNSLFDRKKLIAFNTEHMRMLNGQTLLQRFKYYLHASDSPLGRLEDSTLAHVLRACAGARTLADVAQKSLFLVTEDVVFDPKAVKKVLRKDGAAELLSQVRDALAQIDAWDGPSLNNVIETLCKADKIGMGKVAQPIRVAITGTTVSPPIHDSLVMLGKDRTLGRIDRALEYLRQT